MKKIVLLINGWEMTFEIASKPTEGKCFEVNPMGIDRSLFQKKRSDSRQEETRKYILEAFGKADKYPVSYAQPFITLIPIKIWEGSKTVEELKQYAKELGGQHGNKTEKAFKWAQRISNGETWEAICNDPDTAECYELVDWENGSSKLVGGSRDHGDDCPASSVSIGNYDYEHLIDTVPFVVFSSTVHCLTKLKV